jgi:hypothetical protein
VRSPVLAQDVGCPSPVSGWPLSARAQDSRESCHEPTVS